MTTSRGQPTKYNEEVQEASDAYVEEYSTVHGHQIPSGRRLARILKVHPDTLYEWAKNHVEFSDTLERLNCEQEIQLMDKGLTGHYNATIAKLALHNHGYSDKSAQELSGPGGGAIETDNKWTVEVHEVEK